MAEAEQGLAGEMGPDLAELGAQQACGDGTERGAVEIIKIGAIWAHERLLSQIGG